LQKNDVFTVKFTPENNALRAATEIKDFVGGSSPFGRAIRESLVFARLSRFFLLSQRFADFEQTGILWTASVNHRCGATFFHTKFHSKFHK
jgi:hypothetical protein